jgi:hypothetical protein
MELIDAYILSKYVLLFKDNRCKYMELKHDYMALIDAITKRKYLAIPYGHYMEVSCGWYERRSYRFRLCHDDLSP